MWPFYYWFLLQLIAVSVNSYQFIGYEEPLKRAFEEFVKTNKTPQILIDTMEEVKHQKDFVKDHHPFNRPVSLYKLQSFAVCFGCTVALGFYRSYRQIGGSSQLIEEFLVNMCIMIDIYDEEVCRGTLKLNMNILDFIYDERLDLPTSTLCARLAQMFDCIPYNDGERWVINVAPGVPEERKQYSSRPGVYKMIQLSDLHYEPYYEPGSNANCKQVVCCSSTNGPPSVPEDAAGYWGDYRPCDMPYHTIENMFDQILAEHDQIDFVYYTGDIVSHRIWATTHEYNIISLRDIYELMHKKLGHITLYPALGNHEPDPTNLFPPPEVSRRVPSLSQQWLFDFVAEEWMRWLPKETQKTIKRGGFYTVLHRPGWRIVSLNSNVCFIFNWWLIYDYVDPYDQLQWFSDVMEEAEKNNEMVHILSHIPPGDITCSSHWSNQLRRIINRYAHIIRGHFGGHTHIDELRIFYNLSQPEQVINVAYTMGSFCTFTYFNPTYRMYDIAKDSLEVTDFDAWIFNMDEANAAPRNVTPRWYVLYSLRDVFGMTDASLEDFQELPLRMAQNKTLIEEYYRTKVRDSPHWMEYGCDEDCLLEILCEIVTTEYNENTQCNAVLQKYYYHQYSREIVDQLMDSNLTETKIKPLKSRSEFVRNVLKRRSSAWNLPND